MAKTSKTQTSPAVVAAVKEKKPNLDGQLMTVTIKARETNQNIISTEKLAGAERWFIKKQIKSFTMEGDTATIVATRREFRYRGIEDLAKVQPE